MGITEKIQKACILLKNEKFLKSPIVEFSRKYIIYSCAWL